MKIDFVSENNDFIPIVQPTDEPSRAIRLQAPIECQYLSDGIDQFAYRAIENQAGAWIAQRSWMHENFVFALTDEWRVNETNRLRLARRLNMRRREGTVDSVERDGFQLHLAFPLDAQQSSEFRFFAPGMIYAPSQYASQKLSTFSDQRLAYPLVAAYQSDIRQAIVLSRVELAAYDQPAVRPNRETRYLQETDIGSLGFSASEPALHLFWPYYEGERSALLNASGTSAAAFYPLSAAPLTITLIYELSVFEAETYADAVFDAFKNGWSIAKPQPVTLPFMLTDAINYRLASAAKTYHEWVSDGAGFRLNFDPEHGYDSQPKAFGASFTEHKTGEAQDILEYGFTGRQLNLAYMLAQHTGGDWRERGRRVADFFVAHMTQPSGWVYSMYHLGKGRPIYTVGDPDGTVMHYLAVSPRPGNYTRMMVEVLSDLLLNYQFHKAQGAVYSHWLDTCRRAADFFVAQQNADGSWYRAYEPDGTPIRSGEWFGSSEDAAKSASSIPVSYLLALAAEGDGEAYLKSAQRACDYLLERYVASDEYRGGTLDNPNVVDKEAAMMTLKSLLHLYEQGGDVRYLRGAERAAKLAISWNSIWNVPNIPDTAVARAGVKSTGWGGINSIWGAGVTDIYSLFFLAELVRLSALTGEPLYANSADLIAYGTQQILSYPGNQFGFTDTGMQPEGISFCDQGVDDGLIAKGDIWGGLGWIYTAGTYGLQRYLDAKGR